MSNIATINAVKFRETKVYKDMLDLQTQIWHYFDAENVTWKSILERLPSEKKAIYSASLFRIDRFTEFLSPHRLWINVLNWSSKTLIKNDLFRCDENHERIDHLCTAVYELFMPSKHNGQYVKDGVFEGEFPVIGMVKLPKDFGTVISTNIAIWKTWGIPKHVGKL